MQEINKKKWWIISTKGDPSHLFEDHPEIRKSVTSFAIFYTGLRAYYQVYCYATEFGMRKLYYNMQEHLNGHDFKLVGEEETSQEKILEDTALKLHFAPLLKKLGLLKIK